MEEYRAAETLVLLQIKDNKHKLTRQQYKTLVGQVRAGDTDGALKGLRKILLGGGSNAVKLH